MALGLMISSLFSSSVAAVGSLPLWLIPQITFGGLIVKVKDMGLLAKAMSWLMVTRYSFEALIKTGDQLSRPGTRGIARENTHIVGELYNLGFRTSDVEDVGLSIWLLMLVLASFFLAFMTVATIATGRSRKGN